MDHTVIQLPLHDDSSEEDSSNSTESNVPAGTVVGQQRRIIVFTIQFNNGSHNRVSQEGHTSRVLHTWDVQEATVPARSFSFLDTTDAPAPAICTNAGDCSGNAATVSGNRPSCTCTCNAAWTGSTCATSNVCTNAADCSGNAATVTGNRPSCMCACNSAWTGSTCATSNVCTNSADCSGNAATVSGNRPSCTCTCNAAWTGSTCATSNVCTNAADCSGNAATVVAADNICSCSAVNGSQCYASCCATRLVVALN